jgi:lipopolysaccharide transport system ATP-binding protein
MSSDMQEMAIRADSLGKLYRTGERRAFSDLRETVTEVFRRGNGSRKNQSDDLWALRDVSFGVNRGEVVGILGDNGSGKTTLLKVLGQITSPTQGRAELFGRVGALLDVGAGLHGELTGRENIYLNCAISGMSKTEMERSFDQIVEFAELSAFIDTPLKRYSSGMCVRLAFSVIAHLSCDVFLVDEVLAVGDRPFQQKCMTKMMESVRLGSSILFVGHDLDYLRQFCTRIIVFAAGRIAFDGPPAAALSYYSSIFTSQNAPLVLAR